MRLDRLVRLISQPWAIHSEVLENWCQILDAKLAGHEIPAEFIAAASRSSAAQGEELFTRDGNIAIVPVVGTLVKANTMFSCDSTYADLRQAVTAAENAKGITAILLDGDTPGGTVAGAQETGDFLARMSMRKPLYGWVDDLAASAGYWLLSQTRQIGAHAAADVGSIGVLAVHYDRSGRDQNMGVKRTVLAVGDFKAAGNDTGPLAPDERAYLMDRLTQTYGLFIAAVNKGRPQMSADNIRAMQSRIYKSAEARELGLIDHVMGRDEYIQYIKTQTKGAVSVASRQGARAMKTVEELRAEHTDLIEQIEASAREGMITAKQAAETMSKALADAVATERSCLIALHAAIFGDEANARFAAAAESGISADQAKALGIGAVTDDAATRAAILAGITAAAPDGLKPGQIVQAKPPGVDTCAIYSARTHMRQ
jgi:signal peptide peptidase SppA